MLQTSRKSDKKKKRTTGVENNGMFETFFC